VRKTIAVCASAAPYQCRAEHCAEDVSHVQPYTELQRSLRQGRPVRINDRENARCARRDARNGLGKLQRFRRPRASKERCRTPRICHITRSCDMQRLTRKLTISYRFHLVATGVQHDVIETEV
jgi:hypothetical protein